MPDQVFEHPRLAAVYDALDGERDDLDAYEAMAVELGARRVLDLGCGTGTLALRLAARGLDVTGVDPAAASLAVARGKPGADRVRWVLGDAGAMPDRPVDLVTMTGNAAQAITDPGDWDAMLVAVAAVLLPGGHLVFETRDPAARAWTGWTPAATLTRQEVEGAGWIRHWVELTGRSGPLVSFRGTWVFEADGTTLTSDSTLRFREQAEVEQTLVAHGFRVQEVRDAPDRPGLELVFVAERT